MNYIRKQAGFLGAPLMALCVLGGQALAQDSATGGEKVFKKCAICHSLEPGKIKIGPPLNGVIGRKAGSVKGFRYSKAMKSADIVWNAESLGKYLSAPKKFVPGNRMPFPGLKNSKQRADLIEFLKNVAKNK